MVQKKIIKVLNYARQRKIPLELQPNGNFSIHGFTKEGIKVKIIINPDGKLITAHPVWVEKKI